MSEPTSPHVAEDAVYDGTRTGRRPPERVPLPQAVERALLHTLAEDDGHHGSGYEFKAIAEGAAALGLYSPPQPPQVVNGYDDIEVRQAAEESGLSEEQARAVVNRLRERQAE